MEKEINLSFELLEMIYPDDHDWRLPRQGGVRWEPESELVSWVVKIDNKKYFREGYGPWPCDNLFRNGANSLFMWSKGEPFGYKIFTGTLFGPRWQGAFSFKPSLILSKKQVEALHFSHKALHKLNFTPDSFNLINFNNGEFYGLKMQRIRGTMPTNGWCRRKRIDHEFDDLEQAMKDINLIPRARKEFVGENFIIDSKSNHLYLIDLDWLNIRGREDLILGALRNV